MRHTWILIAGVWIAGLALTGCESHRGDREGVKMSINDVPAVVREGLMREAPKARITSVEREVENGMTVYEADVMQDGKKWELKVDAKGKLLSKKMDDDDEKDD